MFYLIVWWRNTVAKEPFWEKRSCVMRTTSIAEATTRLCKRLNLNLQITEFYTELKTQYNQGKGRIT